MRIITIQHKSILEKELHEVYDNTFIITNAPKLVESMRHENRYPIYGISRFDLVQPHPLDINNINEDVICRLRQLGAQDNGQNYVLLTIDLPDEEFVHITDFYNWSDKIYLEMHSTNEQDCDESDIYAICDDSEIQIIFYRIKKEWIKYITTWDSYLPEGGWTNKYTNINTIEI